MGCDISEEQLWSWIDREAPELEAHLANCPRCRELAADIRSGIQAGAIGLKAIEPPLPDQIGPYKVTGLLGEGGQGVVYAAQQQTPQRPVALKVLKSGRFAREQDLRQFRREIQSMAALQHPAIATIYEAGRTEEGQQYLAMELVAGLPLHDYVRDRALPLRERLELFCRVCDAVHYAHAHGVIHRDLKPTNILIDAEGRPKILDFGLARMTDADVTLTATSSETGHVVGTLRYMSPEQARGDGHAVGVTSDVYALGVILYELLTAHTPYEVTRVIPDAVRTICETPPRRPSSTSGPDGRPARHLRGDLDTIVLKALEKEPARRYPSVEALAADIRRYLAGEPILAKAPSKLYRLRKRVARHRIAYGVGAAVVLLALVGLREYQVAHQRRIAEVRRQVMLTQRRLELGELETGRAEAAGWFKAQPDLPEAVLTYAQADFRQGRAAREQSLCAHAREILHKPAGQTWGWAAKLLLKEMGQPQGEIQVPDTPDAWYLRSFATLDTARALGCVEQALHLGASDPVAWERAAHLRMLLGDHEGAIAAARRLAELTGSAGTWLVFEADVRRRQGRCDEALRACERAAENGRLTGDRALARLCCKRYSEALEDYTQIIEQAKEQPAAWYYHRRATVLSILGRLEEAAADYRECMKQIGAPSFAGARCYLVLRGWEQALLQAGRVAEAQRSREQADEILASARRAVVPGCWLDKVLRCLDRDGGDLAPAELVASADPNNPEQICEAFYYAGEACLLSGDREQALHWFRRCQQTLQLFDNDSFPADPMSEYHLAVWRLDQLTETDCSSRAAVPDPS